MVNQKDWRNLGKDVLIEDLGMGEGIKIEEIIEITKELKNQLKCKQTADHTYQMAKSLINSNLPQFSDFIQCKVDLTIKNLSFSK